MIYGYDEAPSCSSFTSGLFDIDIIFHVHCTKPVWCVTLASISGILSMVLLGTETMCYTTFGVVSPNSFCHRPDALNALLSLLRPLCILHDRLNLSNSFDLAIWALTSVAFWCCCRLVWLLLLFLFLIFPLVLGNFSFPMSTPSTPLNMFLITSEPMHLLRPSYTAT